MLLSINDIHVYYGKSYILQGISLEVNEGEVVALLGRNGVGKTTTLMTIMGLVKPRLGKTFLKEVDITSLPPFKIARLGIGYIPQGRRLFPDMSVLENLKAAMRNTSDTVVLDDIFDLFPALKSRLSQKALTLSGGEQQMLTISRALATKPDILLLDEPTTGLMPALVSKLGDTIKKLNERGIAIFIVEEKIPFTLSLAERAYIMDKGRIEYSGKVEDLRQEKEILYRHLGTRV
ncbi:MAG: ABC transporter ATP-binding protein [Deltaproteobacteria bacterium]|nr:ABC transporter ATP-binding protein [Deltaproteobacteria bacterium]